MQSQVRLICAAVVAALAVSASGLATGAANSSAANRAQGLIDANPGWANRVTGDSFDLRGVVVDNDGTEHVRYNRSYKGLPVIGGDVVVHSKGGNLKSMTQTINNMSRPGLGARVKADDAIVAAGVDFGGGFDGKPTARKVVYAMYSQPTLAWEVVMKGTRADQTPTEMHYFVDANSGAILDAWDMVHSAAANGTGKTITLGDVGITTDSVSGGYQLLDLSRGGGATYDARNAAYTSAAGNAVMLTDADNVWGNYTKTDRATSAAEAHYGVAVTWDYYKNVHGRNGIFNDGKGVKSYVHTGTNWNNAVWYNNSMMYGDGDGTSWLPLTVLDVAGHEMSHGVAQATSGLAYSGDMGGLNEGNSDIFGTLVEFYANNSSDPGDYLIGEEVYISNPNGTKALRHMFKQNIDGASYVCYPSRGFRREDPHYTSGVANRFFYLLAEGAVVPSGFGAGTTYNLTPSSLVCNGNTGLAGIGRTKAGAIWYRALDLYFTSSTKYPNARTATLNAARDLYGSGSPEYNAVAAAWSATNVN
ncbi:M4 family metallopeptidase [Solilutibacter tolerans]|uniref:Neutral metalloproteinase n=1 Tax=Solilutibacter tolerans TaxID=1604334 RepID=A0A1N6NU22_9GAMM|nr:M4 family metallopeptidase [Lysobacter tolerans]SIP95599.1 griselysin. Metallo peptidase. MEROPS family M04 [Lysobacter tolerans]